MSHPPLRLLHASLNRVKLEYFERCSDEDLRRSLAPGHPNGLKVRPDGTILEGNHRIDVLRRRGVPVDDLPREVMEHEAEAEG
jgi:hypothetical protein